MAERMTGGHSCADAITASTRDWHTSSSRPRLSSALSLRPRRDLSGSSPFGFAHTRSTVGARRALRYLRPYASAMVANIVVATVSVRKSEDGLTEEKTSRWKADCTRCWPTPFDSKTHTSACTASRTPTLGTSPLSDTSQSALTASRPSSNSSSSRRRRTCNSAAVIAFARRTVPNPMNDESSCCAPPVPGLFGASVGGAGGAAAFPSSSSARYMGAGSGNFRVESLRSFLRRRLSNTPTTTSRMMMMNPKMLARMTPIFSLLFSPDFDVDAWKNGVEPPDDADVGAAAVVECEGGSHSTSMDMTLSPSSAERVPSAALLATNANMAAARAAVMFAKMPQSKMMLPLLTPRKRNSWASCSSPNADTMSELMKDELRRRSRILLNRRTRRAKVNDGSVPLRRRRKASVVFVSGSCR
eukprot:Opistho-1_new@105901